MQIENVEGTELEAPQPEKQKERGRRVIHLTNDQLILQLDKKMKAGLAKIAKMKREWDAVDCIYQGIAGERLKSLAVDSGVVSSIAGLLPNATANVTLSAFVAVSLYNHKSKLAMSEPTVVASAVGTDTFAKSAQEYVQQYCDNLYQSTPLKRILCQKVYTDVVIRGTGVLGVNWDPHAGEVKQAPDPSDPDSEIIMTGDHMFRYVPIGRFIIDPVATIFEVDAKWCIEGTEYSVEELAWKYPEYRDLILQQAEEHRKGRDFEADETHEETERAASLILWEYYEKHAPENGMLGAHVHFIRAGEGNIKILDRTPLKNKHGQLPFCVFTDIDLSNDVYGLSRGVIATPHYDRLCKFFTDVEKNIELFGHTRILMPQANLADARRVDGIVSIPYNSATGEKPIYLQPSSVTTDIWRFYDTLTREVDMVFSSGEFDRGEINRELSSYAVLTAIERSEAKLVDLFNKKKDFIKRIYTLVLSDAQQFITEERAFAISGYQAGHKFESFVGSNLSGRVGIDVDFGMYMPVDRGARKQQMFELIKLGVLEKAGLPMKDIVSMMIGGDITDVKSALDLAKEVQEEEINRMIEGREVTVQEYHEHLTHMACTAKFMNELPFETLPTEIKQKIYDHFVEHRTRAAKIMAEAQKQGTTTPSATPQATPSGTAQPQAA